MQQNFQTTKGAGNGANSGPGYPPNASWSNPERITADDGSSASIGFFEGGQHGDSLVASQFGFDLPDFAVIDGVSVTVDGSNTGCVGDVYLSAAASGKTVGALNQTYGDGNDLWGEDEIAVADVNDSSFGASIELSDASGGDGIAGVDYIEITVYWHIEIPQIEADVPTRVDYKVYSRNGAYLGLLPNVTSKLAFPQDINTAGSALIITCGKFINNEVTVAPLLTEDGEIITTENDLPILATSTDLVVTTGDSPDDAIFKNSNRVKAILYNKYYPNGTKIFSGQINRVDLKYASGDASVRLTVLSDGMDLNNFIARGFPFNYTTDVSQTGQNGYVVNTVDAPKAGTGWDVYGQTWRTGDSVDNLGQVILRMRGTATVTLSIYDAPNGNLIGSVTKAVSAPAAGANIEFDFAQLLGLSPSTNYFLVPWVNAGQNIGVFRHSSSGTYANGSMYRSQYAGGSGGGLFIETTGDFYFVTKSGLPTTTTTYSTQDPVTGMGSGILADYNARGGFIRERDFEATGLSLTYTFVVATILDALKKIIGLSPSGFYYYVDLGTAEIDIKQVNDMPDFTVVRGRHINELDLGLTIENVRNYFLFTGGETGSTNLFREYQDSVSAALYGQRADSKTDNRVTVTNTADAVGNSFIAENKDEMQETTLVVSNENIDITLLTPGKTIGFKNFGNFIDGLVLQIVRREPNFSDGEVTLTLGRLPIRMSDEIQRIYRELLEEQTINNPSAPS